MEVSGLTGKGNLKYHVTQVSDVLNPMVGFFQDTLPVYVQKWKLFKMQHCLRDYFVFLFMILEFKFEK